MERAANGEHAIGWTDLLAIGFGTTVAMWAVGYAGRMPLTDVPPRVFVSLMLVCLAGGGWFVGRKTSRGARGGLGLGLVVGLLNLLILGSVAKRDDGSIVPEAWLWLPGYFVVCLAVATAGAAAGTVGRPKSDRSPDWLFSFACTACAATLLLIAFGGLVTGFRAGMAVPDWPTTYGSNMFLYPLGKMNGAIFYEHAHRLLGALVGLTALTLAMLLTIHRRSRSATILIWVVGSCTLLQGIMGALRVIFPSPEVQARLAVLHGFFAHAILAGMVGVAFLLRPRSRATKTSGDEACPNEVDCRLTALLVLAILGQTLFLGTLVRQMNVGWMIHATVAMFVAMLAVTVGVRLWGLYPHIAVLARGGVALMCVVVLQLFLGGTALLFPTPKAADSPSAEQLQTQADAQRPAAPAIVTTAHQTNAAVLLATATLLAFWTWRLAAVRRSAVTVEVPAESTEALPAAS